MQNNQYIDTHTHLYLEDNPFIYKVSDIIKENVKNNIKEIWIASTNFKDINKNLLYQKKYTDLVKVWIGFHPENFESYDHAKFTELVKININNIIGIGEIGIDLDERLIETSSLSKKAIFNTQGEVFDKQLKLALEYKLPVAIHSRNATNETIEVLEKFKDITFVWHCYNLDLNKTRKLLNKFKNIYFGFNNIITYKSGDYINESLKEIPKEKILLETDAPFLAPRPFVHKYNSSLGVINVYQHVAKTLLLQTSELCEIILSNTKQFKQRA